MQPGFSLWSFRRAYLELYFDLCFDFLFFNKIYETNLLQEFCVFYSHLTGALWMDSVGDGGAWKNGTEEKEFLEKGVLLCYVD